MPAYFIYPAMPRFFTLLLGGLSAALLLAACQRASYPLLPDTPLFAQPAPAAMLPARADLLGATVVLRKPAATAAFASALYLPAPSVWPKARTQLVQPAGVAKLGTNLPAASASVVYRPILAQRLLLKHVVAKLRKKWVAGQNAARTQASAELSPAGRAMLIAIIGLVLLLIALLIPAHTIEGAAGIALLTITGILMLIVGAGAMLIIMMRRH